MNRTQKEGLVGALHEEMEGSGVARQRGRGDAAMAGQILAEEELQGLAPTGGFLAGVHGESGNSPSQRPAKRACPSRKRSPVTFR